MRSKAESDIHLLNKRVLEAEVKMTDAKSEASTKSQSERILRRRFDNLQTQLKEKDSLHEQRLQDIQVSTNIPNHLSCHITSIQQRTLFQK